MSFDLVCNNIRWTVQKFIDPVSFYNCILSKSFRKYWSIKTYFGNRWFNINMMKRDVLYCGTMNDENFFNDSLYIIFRFISSEKNIKKLEYIESITFNCIFRPMMNNKLEYYCWLPDDLKQLYIEKNIEETLFCLPKSIKILKLPTDYYNPKLELLLPDCIEKIYVGSNNSFSESFTKRVKVVFSDSICSKKS